ncbi:hypothetical protein C8Q74DRAFT_1450538 [Fomes fomentarius]|nr:hypothetical protein C8Q74DRAFT_1450538 [Fomes fomentarius]
MTPELLLSVYTLKGCLRHDGPHMRREELELAASSVLAAFIDIQKRINSLAPINATLPSELLLEVFKLAVHASECSWTIPIPLNRRVDEADSQVIRLTHLNGSDDGELWQLVAKNGSRLRTLHLDIDIQSPFVPLLSSLPAPGLQCLTVSSSRHQWEHHSRYYDDDAFQRSPLLDHCSRSLRALAIDPVTTWFPTNSFPALTHLLVGPSPVLHDLLNTLAGTPLLEFLHVTELDRHRHDDVWEDYLLPPKRVPLQKLRSIVLRVSQCGTAFQALSALSIPSDVLICLDDVSGSSQQPIPLPQLDVMDTVTRLELSISADNLHFIAEGRSSGLWLHYCDKFTHARWDEWFSYLYASTPLHNITCLEICLHGHDTYLPDLLAQLSALTELRVAIDPDYDIDRIGPCHRMCLALSQRPIKCPALRSLRIEEWSRHHDNDPDALQEMLATRASAGHPVHRFVMQLVFTSQYCPSTGLPADQAAIRQQYARLAEHVVQYEFIGPCTSTTIVQSEPHEMWNVEGAETYWSLRENEKPACKKISSWKMVSVEDGSACVEVRGQHSPLPSHLSNPHPRPYCL